MQWRAQFTTQTESVKPIDGAIAVCDTSTERSGATALVVPDDLDTDQKVAAYLQKVYDDTERNGPAAALVPWVCDRLLSNHSRRAYAGDLASFVWHMRARGIHPLDVTGNDLRIYKAAMVEGGRSEATIARVLSVIRGTYQQFGRSGLMDWETVRDIQGIESPRVEKNTTPALTEQEAVALLHAPSTDTLVGLRDHAMLFTFFRTACRCSAITNACVGHIHREDHEFFLLVTEKGRRKQRKALLEAAPVVLRWIEVAGIGDDTEGPLFRPVTNDKQRTIRKHLTGDAVLKMVKRYARKVGIDVKRYGTRGIGVHSLRKTTITNALQHGAKMEQVQALAGHADIRTTQLYFEPTGKEAEEAARHIQIR